MKMKKELLIGYKGKKIKIAVWNCNFFKKFSGLMFSNKDKAEILLFDFKIKQTISIHSFFVFYDFLAVWLDDKNKVIDLKKVKPFQFCVSPKKTCFKLVEIPINSKNKKIISKFLPKNYFSS
jgi:uncharacterized membrane protein (UPF0127 family)